MEYIVCKPIDKGWSVDKKFCVTDEEGRYYFLRVSPAERRGKVEKTFEMMNRVAKLGVPMCRPVECGICDEGVYVLQEWIEGTDAEEAMKTLDNSKRYAYGLDAGRALREIHSLPSEGERDWAAFFNSKIERKIKGYEECTLKYPGGDALIGYINANRHFLAGRPVTYQHGDFHVGNMMINQSGKLVIIDFDRDDYGDPWEEFNRIVWSAQSAPAFARGIVDGYFDGCIPEEFWRLLALYIATNTLSSLPWAIPYGEREISVMLHQCEEVLQWYDGMNNPIPVWYREC